jgi:hypothetical protein
MRTVEGEHVRVGSFSTEPAGVAKGFMYALRRKYLVVASMRNYAKGYERALVPPMPAASR